MSSNLLQSNNWKKVLIEEVEFTFLIWIFINTEKKDLLMIRFLCTIVSNPDYNNLDLKKDGV